MKQSDDRVQNLIDAFPHIPWGKYYDLRGRDIIIELGELGDLRAFNLLFKTFRNMNDFSTHAARALGKLGDPRAIEPLMQELSKEIDQSKATRDQDIHMQRAIVEALGELRDTRAFNLLVKCLSSPDNCVRIYTVDALNKIGDPRAIEPLISAFRSRDTAILGPITCIMAEIKDIRFYQPLLEIILEDKICPAVNSEHYIKALNAVIGKNTEKSFKEIAIDIIIPSKILTVESKVAILENLGDFAMRVSHRKHPITVEKFCHLALTKEVFFGVEDPILKDPAFIARTDNAQEIIDFLEPRRTLLRSSSVTNIPTNNSLLRAASEAKAIENGLTLLRGSNQGAEAANQKLGTGQWIWKFLTQPINLTPRRRRSAATLRPAENQSVMVSATNNAAASQTYVTNQDPEPEYQAVGQRPAP